MRVVIPVFVFALTYTIAGYSVWSSAAVAIWSVYITNLLLNINNVIAFREYILVMYGLNYLFSPALQYHDASQAYTIYRMKLSEEEYFSLAIPAMFCLQLGLYVLKTKIFTQKFNLNATQSVLNQTVLKQWIIGGILLNFLRPFVPGELSYLVYLVSGIRFVGAFGLFIIDRKKYKWFLLGILFIEITTALASAMFHDMVVWILFFGLVWAFLNKPSIAKKLILGFATIFCFYVLQVAKPAYREQLRTGQGSGFDGFSSAVSKNTEGGGLLNVHNFTEAITRSNQGWIFASSVERMNRVKDFQEMTIVKKYAEAAFLPRYLAPDKMQAGDKQIFNTFSGAKIGDNTSMGLGILADGYISYGFFGALLFAFTLGLIFSIVFRIVEGWSNLSPFFVLFIFPILNYAVRADCETQTIMTHLVKGTLVFGLVITYYKRRYFKKRHSFLNTPDSLEAQLVVSPN